MDPKTKNAPEIKELAKKIVSEVNKHKNDYDSIEAVESILISNSSF